MYFKDSMSLRRHYRFDTDDPFLMELRREWGNKLNQAFSEMPRIPESNQGLSAIGRE
jgi:putative proteasome-type protease